jgi:DHA1 family bicyclomycin/chloramphenicol resistance-like MFS transporter
MLIFITVIFSIFVAGAEVDIAIPSFPEIRAFFDISPFMVELVLGVNLLAHCIAALFCGGLGDKYGKKRVINYGFIIFTLGSLVCATANNFGVLLFGRILQGVGVAPGMVLSFIIAIEQYDKNKQEKVMGMLNGFSTLSISIAPSLGSYVNYYFTWHGNFWLLFILGLLALISFQLFVPDDKKHEEHIKINIKDYFILLKNKMVFFYVTTLCLCIGAYYTFVGLAPILYIEGLGVNLKHFGLYQGALTLTFGIFSIMSGAVVGKLGKKNSVILSFSFILSFVIVNATLVTLNINNPLIITLTLLLLSVGFVIPCNIMFVLALEIIPEAKGRVSALISTIKWIFAIIGVQGASYFYKNNYFAIGVFTTSMVLIAIFIFIKLWKIDEKLRASYGFVK